MSKTKAIITKISLLLALSILGWGFYFHLKNERLMELIGEDSIPTVFTPTEPGDTHMVSLGYAEIQLPDSITQIPFRVAPSTFLMMMDSSNNFQNPPDLIFFGPFNPKWTESQETLDSVNLLSKKPVVDWFELQKKILQSVSFDVWDSLKNGSDWTAKESILLLLKKRLFGKFESSEIYQNDQMGLCLIRGLELTRIIVTHRESGREIHLESRLDYESNRQIATALIHSFRPLGEWDTLEGIVQLIDDSGIPLVDEPPSSPVAFDIHSEVARLQAVVDEVKRRRALRQKPLEALPIE